MPGHLVCCDLCGAPLLGVLLALPDGQRICPDHQLCPHCAGAHLGRRCEQEREAIGLATAPRTVARLAGQVRATLAGLGLDLPAVLPRIVTALPSGRAGQTLAWWSTGPAPTPVRIEIEITAGHGPHRFGAIYAHELTHAHIKGQTRGPIEPVVEEGVCELVAVIWMRAAHVSENLVSQAWHNPHPIYGAGLRRAAQSAQRHGIHMVLAHVITRHQLP